MTSMSKITKSDIESFSRVLREFSQVVESDPDAFLALLERSVAHRNQSPVKLSSNTSYSSRVQDVDLYSFAKQGTEDQLVELLRTFSVDELKELLKKYSLGYTKLRTVDSIAQYIAGQMKKRTTDVFMQHENSRNHQ